MQFSLKHLAIGLVILSIAMASIAASYKSSRDPVHILKRLGCTFPTHSIYGEACDDYIAFTQQRCDSKTLKQVIGSVERLASPHAVVIWLKLDDTTLGMLSEMDTVHTLIVIDDFITEASLRTIAANDNLKELLVGPSHVLSADELVQLDAEFPSISIKEAPWYD